MAQLNVAPSHIALSCSRRAAARRGCAHHAILTQVKSASAITATAVQIAGHIVSSTTWCE
jgi:hypothetical protein